MTQSRNRLSMGMVVYLTIAFMTGSYFAISAMQGEFGLFARIQVDAEAVDLQADVDRLSAEVAEMRNLTRRLSDAYLDLDLLDQQARDVLGYVRADEIVLR
jgi:cell division protein FtsB